LGQLHVAIFLQVDDAVVVGQDAGLGKAVNAFVNFAVNKTIDGDGLESVVLDDGGWDVLQCHAHVFWACHWRVQIKILDVKRHELGAGCRDDSVEEPFGRLKVGTFGGNISGVTYFVSTNSDADALGLFLMWAISDIDSRVCCPVVGGNVVVLDETKGVAASGDGYSCGW
jgi:hypothetical protein